MIVVIVSIVVEEMVLLPFDCVLDDYSKSDKKLINLKKNNVRKQNARANTVSREQTSVTCGNSWESNWWETSANVIVMIAITETQQELILS